MRILAMFLVSIYLSSAAAYIKNPSTDNLSVVSNPMVSSITNQITIVIWLSKDTNGFSITLEPTFISKGGAGLESQYNSGLRFTNKLGFGFKSAASAFNSAWGTADNGYTVRDRIDFIAVTYNFSDTNSMRLMLNGTELSVGWIQTMTNVPPVADGNPLRIGTESTGRRWTGYYSEVAIWSEILTSAQLELIRKSRLKGMPLQINPSNLRIYLPLDTVSDTMTVPGGKAYPDRKNFGPGATASGTPHGRAERICSYQPNE